MSLSNNFPAIAPSLSLDFANTKRLDPRISFTRTTTATYYDGVTTSKAEENLLLQSQDFTTSWTNAGSTDTANTEVAPDGTTTADTITASVGTSVDAGIYQSGKATTSGLTYTYSVFAKAGTHDYLQITNGTINSTSTFADFDLNAGTAGTTGNCTSTITSFGNGWYRCTMTATAETSTTNGIVYFMLAASDTATRLQKWNPVGTETVYLWGAQLEQRSAVSSYTPTTTQPITNYIPALQTAASGVARFDHNPTTNESLGLLVEEQRTNLLTYSQEFDDSDWAKTRTSVTANTIVAPDGTLTGEKFIATSVSGTHVLNQSISVTAQAYTLSCYAKAGEYNLIQLNIPDPGAGGAGKLGSFNLSTGALGVVQDTGVSRTITPVGNGWYRCSITFTTTGAGTSAIGIFVTNTDVRAESFTGNDFNGIYIWGAQLEAGAFPTSYIATTSASVTRNADAASMTGTNFSSWYRADEGTVYSEIASAVSINQRGYSISDNSNNNAIANILTNSGGSGLSFEIRALGSVWAGVPTTTTPVSNQYYKLAGAYAFNDVAASRDGGTVGTDGSAVMPLNVDRLYLGSNQSGTGGFINGTIKKLAYYPSRLADAQLQALTS